jgi:hypothetical protein
MSATNPFSNPKGTPDYAYWARMPLWTYEEARDLALNREPKWKPRVTGFRDKAEERHREAASRLYALILRAKESGEFRDKEIDGRVAAGKVRPLFFIAWCARKGIELPDDLAAAVEAQIALEKGSRQKRPSPRVPQSEVSCWYNERWSGLGGRLPSQEEDVKALKEKFGHKATRTMLKKERSKHPELAKRGRRRVTNQGPAK